MGILACDHKRENIETICKKLEINYQSLHHFISDSPWDHRKIFERVATLTNELYKKVDEPIVLAIDETSFHKKGKSSAGVARQYLGCRQNEANGQVIVCSTLVQGTNTNMIDAELYVPEEFMADSRRMKKAGIDPDTYIFQNKLELAQTQIDNTLKLGIKPDMVVADAFYGSDSKFRQHCRTSGVNYLLSIKSNITVWFSEPKDSKVKREKISNYKKHINSDTILKKVPFVSNKHDNGKGKRKDIEVIAMPIWTTDKTENEITQEYVIVSLETGEEQFIIGNTPVSMENINSLVYLYKRRYFVERAFQNGKQMFGMDGNQTRKYRAFMHHLAAVSVLGLHFLEELYARITEAPKMTYQALYQIYKNFLNFLGYLTGTHEREIEKCQNRWDYGEKSAPEPPEGELTK